MRPRVYVTQPIAESALIRLREIAEVELNRRFQPHPAEVQAGRCRQAQRHHPVSAARHHRPRGAGRQSDAEGGRLDDDHARPHRCGRGDHAQDHRHQHSGRGHRCHRRSRLRAAARRGTPDRGGRQGGALGRVSRARNPTISQAPALQRQDARHCRHRPDRAGGGAPRARFRHEGALYRPARAYRWKTSSGSA